MNCPACHQEMVEQDFGGVKVDVCQNGCKSLWFDWIELGKLDEQQEGMGQALNDALNSARHKDENRGRLSCPKCGTPMAAHFYKYSKVVTVDECYSCGGFFLDSGELEVIRGNYMSEKDRENYVGALLNQKSEYLAAVEQLKVSQGKINPGTEKRMKAVSGFSGMLLNKFRK